jgi:hypothetical protein
MKLRNYIYILLAGTVTISSCSKDFLDEKPPQSLPITEAIKNETDMADAVNGMYSTLRSSSFYGRDIPVLGDELADNAYISNSNSGRYTAAMNYTYIATNAEASNIWTQGYYSILQANRIIFAGATVPVTGNSNQLRGEAYAVRALVYLQLVNFFAPSAAIASNLTAPGVPLVTQPTFVTGPQTKPARASVGDIYNKIISDLDSAFTLMPASGVTVHASNSNYIAKYAAKAIQARAFLYKGDYTNAITAAKTVVDNGGYTLATSANYVNYWAGATATTTKQETIFELALNNATNNGTNGLDYIYAQGGYGDLLAYEALYNLYSTTDVRRNLILTSSPTRGNVYVVNKYSNLSNANEKDDVKVIRYSEVLLTLAEAYARTGDNTNALLYANQVAQRRDPSFVGFTSVGTGLANDIVIERRKELAFEGLRYFDLTRLNLPVERPNQTNTAPRVATLATTSPKRVLPIPQSEIDVNPNIVQNPGY